MSGTTITGQDGTIYVGVAAVRQQGCRYPPQEGRANGWMTGLPIMSFQLQRASLTTAESLSRARFSVWEHFAVPSSFTPEVVLAQGSPLGWPLFTLRFGVLVQLVQLVQP